MFNNFLRDGFYHTVTQYEVFTAQYHTVTQFITQYELKILKNKIYL